MKSGRPAWQSPWAAAAVLALIAITTGVTFLGRKAPAAGRDGVGAAARSEIGTNPDGVAVFIDGANRGITPLTISLPPARTSSSSSPRPIGARCP